MNFKIKLLGLASLLIIAGCRKDLEKDVESEATEIQQETAHDFDKILKCNDYIITGDGNAFTTCYDNGCVYDPKGGNVFGNLVTYLIPKDFLFFQKHSGYIEKWDYEKLEAYVNRLSIEEFKKQFDIYVFLVDKKYLIPTPGYDSPYDFKEKYQTDLYQYQNNSWKKIDQLVSLQSGNEAMNWRDNFVLKKSNEISKAFFDKASKFKIDESWYRDYILPLESYEPSYNYAYSLKVSKDSTYVMERALNDMLIPLQKGDTLFLYHNKSLIGEKYTKNKMIPELKIVRVKGKYFIDGNIFDLENSISNKPGKYGFLVEEIE
ncbi:hypothetical protein ABGT15_06560 [Flavobacterium enshiense]|uniref:hypothetical protein n=1 Tax=Flavobacterium enshiense TaxID=1341165 RepID=UPI00345DF8AF